MQQPAIALLAAAVRSALAAETGRAGSVVPITDPAASGALGAGFLEAVARHRVASLVAPAAAELGLGPDTVDALAVMHREETLAAMAGVARTGRTSAALADASLPHLMFKGPALAVQTTGSPTSRGAGDVDVLVAPTSVAAAVRALGQGFDVVGTPAPDDPTFAATLRSQKEVTLLLEGVEYDLHWRLDDARSCLTWSFDELLGGSEIVALGGIEVPTLGRRHATSYNASHAGSDSWSHLRALVDQVRLQQGQGLGSLRAEAYRVGAGRRWDLAQVMVARLMGDPEPQVSRSVVAVADAMWRWLLAGEGPRDRRNARASLRGFGASVATLDSPRAAAQRAEAVVWPVGAMAERALGDVGDRHPWLYPLATPYFLPKRLVARWRTSEA